MNAQSALQDVEDVYPLTPMQESMLLHDLTAPDGGVLFNQFCYAIRGTLDTEAFAVAWQELVDRHPALRTAFLWEGLKQPLQVVRRSAELPFELRDLRRLPDAERDAQTTEHLRADRADRFDPTRAPLLRCSLLRMEDDAYRLVWSMHHLIMDRWCLPIVWQELSELYDAARRGETPALRPAPRFGRYVEWVQRQRAERERYWGSALRGLAEVAPITQQRASGPAGTAQPRAARLTVSRDLSERLRRCAQRQGVSLGVLVQGAWALQLGELTGRDEVCFGLTVSGRAAPVPGIESTLGSFISNVPIRLSLPGGERWPAWLRSIHEEQFRRVPFEHASPAELQALADLPEGTRLFDHVLVWLSSDEARLADDAAITGLPGRLATSYPLTVAVSDEAAGLVVDALLAAGHEAVEPLPRLLGRLEAILRAIDGAEEDRTLGSLETTGGQATSDVVTLDADAPSDALGEPGPHAAPLPAHGKEEPALTKYHTLEGIEMFVATQFERLLGVDSVDRNASFFELGGDSVQALRLHSLVEASLGLVVPMLSLFRVPTVAGMAQTLHARDWPLAPSVLRVLRASGNREPVFCIASPDVNTVGYALLARHLDPERPIFVAQALPEAREPRPLELQEVSALARSYVEEIRKARPHGPYHLLGMCSGAHIAVEMARILRERGEQVGWVGIINTWALFTVSRWYHLYRAGIKARYYGRRLRDLWKQSNRERIATIGGVLRRRLGSPAVPGAPAQPGAPDSSDAATGLRRSSWVDDFAWTADAQDVPRFAGVVTVLRLVKHPQWWRIRDEGLGWGRFCERVSLVYLEQRNHYRLLMEPGVREIAERVEDGISQAPEADLRPGTNRPAT